VGERWDKYLPFDFDTQDTHRPGCQLSMTTLYHTIPLYALHLLIFALFRVSRSSLFNESIAFGWDRRMICLIFYYHEFTEDFGFRVTLSCGQACISPDIGSIECFRFDSPVK
jgi:hypothetical protein